jgi:hypothetical protein
VVRRNAAFQLLSPALDANLMTIGESSEEEDDDAKTNKPLASEGFEGDQE